jgi:hypothetical protein
VIAGLVASLMLLPATEAANPPVYFLVAATAVKQTDPRPVDCGPENICLDAVFTAEFDRARSLYGPTIPRHFKAEVIQHSPFRHQRPVLLIVNYKTDGQLNIYAQSGADRRGRACFDQTDLDRINFAPAGHRIRHNKDGICVRIE